MTDEFEKWGYEAALRSLDKQERLLEELRTRTGVLLATSSVVTSLLSQEAFQDPRPRFLAVATLVAFVGTTGACLFLLHPKQDLAFGPEGTVLYETLGVKGEREAFLRQATFELGRRWDSNSRRIDVLTRVFTFAAGAFLLQTLSLVALLGDTILH